MLSKNAPVAYVIEGREFVALEDFFACYPQTPKPSKQIAAAVFDVCSLGEAERLVPDVFFQNIVEMCLETSRGSPSLYAPVVLKDGWVFWVSAGHPQLIDALSELLKPRETLTSEEILAVAAARNREDLLTDGKGWYVSTQDPHSIYCGKSYIPSPKERDLFEMFRVMDIY